MFRPKYSGTGLIAVLVILTALLVASCIKPTSPDNKTGVVAGTVFGAGRTSLSDVTVSIGTVTANTDSNGDFILPAITPGAKVLVDFTKDGYIPVQKVVSVEKNRTTYISCTMFTPATSTFEASAGAALSDGGSVINIPINAFVTSTGSVFTGTVTSEVKYFDPMNAQNLDAFPGSFSGVQTDGNETMFESYGFIYASFTDASNPDTDLALGANQEASLSIPIPAALAAGAPETMPLWYYDEVTGKWMEQGSATKQGDFYVGDVSHFSYWNFDHPIQIDDQSTLTGRVLAEESKSPVAGAQVVATGVNYGGYTSVYTDANGDFAVSVKASAQVRLQAFAGQNLSMPTDVINTPAGGQTAAYGDLIVADLSFTVIGKLLDTSGNSLPQGYGMISQENPPDGVMPFNAWISIDENGNFSTDGSYTGTESQIQIRIQFMERSVSYSNIITMLIPQPGQVRNLGNITMRPPGKLKGRARTDGGEWIPNQWVSFNQEGATGEGSYFSGNSDEDGYFILEGPPNANLTSMRGNIYFDDQSWESNLMNLQFPGSGSQSNIGTVIFTPQETDTAKTAH
ncbi:MAG: carboxypeptidase-like regulatory domain-containing protein [Candidatus Cloacimonetes bacterium]|nr:carboxypeptidase-like regulatory domain-containing protein [Candidatus Cloacimonadota bacterium]